MLFAIIATLIRMHLQQLFIIVVLFFLIVEMETKKLSFYYAREKAKTVWVYYKNKRNVLNHPDILRKLTRTNNKQNNNSNTKSR